MLSQRKGGELYEGVQHGCCVERSHNACARNVSTLKASMKVESYRLAKQSFEGVTYEDEGLFMI